MEAKSEAQLLKIQHRRDREFFPEEMMQEEDCQLRDHQCRGRRISEGAKAHEQYRHA
jgi:hypothetical protein